MPSVLDPPCHGIKGEVTVEVRTDEPELRLGPGAV
ncbi:hypothetical protein ABZ476_25700, partial [Streptomyces albogriseolus]